MNFLAGLSTAATYYATHDSRVQCPYKTKRKCASNQLSVKKYYESRSQRGTIERDGFCIRGVVRRGGGSNQMEYLEMIVNAWPTGRNTVGQFRPPIALRTDLSHITTELWEISMLRMAHWFYIWLHSTTFWRKRFFPSLSGRHVKGLWERPVVQATPGGRKWRWGSLSESLTQTRWFEWGIDRERDTTSHALWSTGKLSTSRSERYCAMSRRNVKQRRLSKTDET